MPTITNTDSSHAAGTPSVTSDNLQERLAEAARYAVLLRIAPVLRHDVAGFMQPVGMLMLVLQRRVQMPEPDMQAIVQNVMAVSALAKEATTGCMNAMAWMASTGEALVGMRCSVDQAIKLLAMELSGSALQIVNNLPDDTTEIPQSFLRSVLMGALLAFCDQRTTGGKLQLSFEAEPGHGSVTPRLMLRMSPDGAALPPAPADAVHKTRSIDWQDVAAMAGSLGLSMSRGEGWLALDLPTAE